MSQIVVVVFSLQWFLYAQKIKIVLSVSAALITINDNSCYFVITFFQETGSSYSFKSGMLLACAEFAVMYAHTKNIDAVSVTANVRKTIRRMR